MKTPLLLGCTVLAGLLCSATSCRTQNAAKVTDWETLFQNAVTAKGRHYEHAEKVLVEAGNQSAPVLKKHLTDTDPVSRVIAKCILEIQSGNAPEFAKSLTMMDDAERFFRPTRILYPSPTGMASRIMESLTNKPAEFLALRLVKGATTPPDPDKRFNFNEINPEKWAHWKAFGVLEYLAITKSTAAVPLILRFVNETYDSTWKTHAIDVLQRIADPNLPAKITTERSLMKEKNRELDSLLVSLEKNSW